jgi:hypothetical protein
MVDRARLSVWWQTELEREHTKLECGLFGALFATVAITFVIILRFMVL